MSENNQDKPEPMPDESNKNMASEPRGEATPAPEPSASPAPAPDSEIDRQIRQLSRRSFLWAAAAALAGVAGWRWLATRRKDDGIPWPLRRMLETNEQLARDYFKSDRLAPTFPRAMARMPRVNGDLGLDDDFDPDTWALRVVGLSEAEDAETLTLDDIENLPRVEMVTELKCIEGWSEIVYWGGARFADFMDKYGPDLGEPNGDPVRYVSLETPNGDYYVGLDMASARHPQTLLCYEMNGEPLTPEHGAPLRLVIPVKYGIKNIKRIGTIRFTNRRPADYWAERGYDWYSGH